MYFTPLLPTDLNGVIDAELLKLSEAVCLKSIALGSVYPPQVIEGIRSMLRTVNSYYSNKIESEGTHPLDIEKASRKIFSEDTREQQLQKLSLVHIEVQKWIEEKMKEGDPNRAFNREFIREVHQKFYSHPDMEPFLAIKTTADSTETIQMIPGVFREQTVYVGSHTSPEYTLIPTLFSLYESSYKVSPYATQAMKLIYAVSSHHRLTWIHPFLDGNGRTSRLVLDGILTAIGLKGYGLWNISRGLARRSSDYKGALAFADSTRQGDMDGRGALTLKGFKAYVKFMLETALDQVEFMDANLKLHTLSQRIENYVKFSRQKMYNTDPMPKYSEFLLKELLIRGEMPRGEVADVIHASDRTATTLIKQLTEIDFIESDTPKGAIRMKFNAHFASEIFPDLISRR